MLEKGESLAEFPAIGKDLAAKIQEIAETGTTVMLEEYRKALPATITQFLTMPGLGPKRVKALHETLGVKTLDALADAARQGRIRALHGFGAVIERRILEALEARRATQRRFKLADARQYAEALVKYLTHCSGVIQIAVAGSYRRAMETIGDLDLLVTATPDSDVMPRFVSYGEVEEVVAQGTTRTTVRLACGLQVDLRVVSQESYGAAL